MTNVEMLNEVNRSIAVLNNIKVELIEKRVKVDEVKKEEKKVLSARMMNFKKDEANSLNRKFYQPGYEFYRKEIFLLLKTRVSTTEKLIAKKEKEVENLEKLKAKLEAMKQYVRDMELFENMK